ncbi:MAG: hypothetical protein FJZ95_01920 [Chloroflexi bacterium]|nr:hypothetical protein [Chloroflexota bacterium]
MDFGEITQGGDMRSLNWMGVMITLIVLVAFPAGVLGNGDTNDPAPQANGDRILVKFNPGAGPSEIAEIHRQNDGNVKEFIGGIDAQIVEVGKGQGSEKAKKYQLHAGVAWAEIDAVCEAVETPDDPYVKNQWAIAKVQAPAAWDITKGSSTVRIAILDTGIDLDHPDLAAKIVLSANFTGSTTTDDMYGHGTHVAGIAAAQTNNTLGVAGLGRDSSLMNGKVLGDDGQGYMSWVAGGIIWAADNGANVISMSLGTTSSSLAVQDAVNYAWNKGAVVVAAAGNNGNTTPFYPAYYTNCIAVAATDSTDALATFSNRGDWVDVAAPGVSTYSTTRGGNYGYMSGTSMASPNAAGLAGLIFAIATDTNGNGRLNDEVRTRLESGCDAIGVTGIGSGRINAFNSVQGAPAPTTGSLSGMVSDASTGSPISGATVSCAGKSTITDASGGYSILDIPQGSYTAAASMMDYEDSSRSVTIISGQTSMADFALAPLPPAPPPSDKSMWVESITFTVKGGNLEIAVKVTGDSGIVSGATVKLQVSRDGTTIGNYSAVTDSTGKATVMLKKPSVGTYTATVTALSAIGYVWNSSTGVNSASYTLAKVSTKSR